MRILVACESSSVVASHFRHAGHEAFSCDLKPTELKTFAKYHIRQDAILTAYDSTFKWDLMIAHPPCQYLAVSGHFHNNTNPARIPKTAEALEFALALWHAPIKRIALEQPRSILSRYLGPAHYTYHPWYFGESYSKFTCLWLKNLPFPRQTHFHAPSTFLNRDPITGYDTLKVNSSRPTERARTLPGVARAFVNAWGHLPPL